MRSHALAPGFRHLTSVVRAQAGGAACLSVVAITGSPWSVVGVGFWLPIYLGVCTEWRWDAWRQAGEPCAPGRADLGPRSETVAWEGIVDYLAWDWWRRRFGEADAGTLREDLFHGRMRLAPDFAVSNAPGVPPRNLTDSQDRALIYGRGPLGWIAAENQAGREAVRTVLRRSLPGAEEVMTVDSILEAAEPAPQVSDVLNSWWLDPNFEPEVLRPPRGSVSPGRRR